MELGAACMVQKPAHPAKAANEASKTNIVLRPKHLICTVFILL